MVSRVWLFATPWTIAHQAPPSMKFSRQEYWSGLPFPHPGDLPNPGIQPSSCAAPVLAARALVFLAAFVLKGRWGWASLVAQMVKNPPAMQEIWVRFLDWEDSLEKEMATLSSILAWRIPWTEESGRLQFIGSQRVRHTWATKHTTLYIILSCSQMTVFLPNHKFTVLNKLKA